jgi:hypothetical protein
MFDGVGTRSTCAGMHITLFTVPKLLSPDAIVFVKFRVTRVYPRNHVPCQNTPHQLAELVYTICLTKPENDTGMCGNVDML